MFACVACGRLNSDPGPEPKADAQRANDAAKPGSDAGSGTMDSGMPTPDAFVARPE